MSEQGKNNPLEAEITPAMKMDFVKFAKELNSLGDPRESLLIDENNLFIARRPEMILPGQNYEITRQYFRPSNRFSVNDLRAEIVFNKEEDALAKVKSIELVGKNGKDLLSINVGNSVDILACINNSSMDLHYETLSGEIQRITLTNPNGVHIEKRFSFSQISEMRRDKKLDINITDISHLPLQKLTVQRFIDPSFSEIIMSKRLLENPFNKDLALDSSWINADWQKYFNIRWSQQTDQPVNRTINIRDAVK